MAELMQKGPSAAGFEHLPLGRNLLRWLYVGRLTLVTGILAGALFVWNDARSQDTLVVVVMFLVALAATAASFWMTDWVGSEPSKSFLYAQVILDVALVTGIVHVTGGSTSGFASIYILVICAGALLLPLPGGVLIGGLVSISYFADLAWAHEGGLTQEVALSIVLFSLVAVVTGLVGDRVRRAGQELGAVTSQLQQLRLDTGDILANLATGVITVTGEGRLAYANPAADALLGLALSHQQGELVLADLERVAPGLGGMLDGAIRTRRPVERARVRALTHRGNVQLGVSTAVLERGEGEAPSVTALFQDITNSERLEELNVRAERLEAVAALSASLAHEIKNPLASIRSSVEQLATAKTSASDRAILERLVLSESDRLSRLLTEFLEFSALEVQARDQVDLNVVVRGCLVVAKQHPDAAQVDIRSRLAEGPIYVLGDADLIHRAIFNLVLNGAQSAGPGGCVTVRLDDERDHPRPRGTEIEYPVRLTVSDSGPGISAELEARIFDPFFTTKRGGSGLGLSVVHRAVEAHHGATFVETGPDGGAQFVIFLPGLPANIAAGVGGSA